jgi:hypothetical protein
VSPFINFRMAEPVFMYITAPKPISAVYFINPFHQSVCLYVYPILWLLRKGSVKCIPPFVAKQRLSSKEYTQQ